MRNFFFNSQEHFGVKFYHLNPSPGTTGFPWGWGEATVAAICDDFDGISQKLSPSWSTARRIDVTPLRFQRRTIPPTAVNNQPPAGTHPGGGIDINANSQAATSDATSNSTLSEPGLEENLDEEEDLIVDDIPLAQQRPARYTQSVEEEEESDVIPAGTSRIRPNAHIAMNVVEQAPTAVRAAAVMQCLGQEVERLRISHQHRDEELAATKAELATLRQEVEARTASHAALLQAAQSARLQSETLAAENARLASDCVTARGQAAQAVSQMTRATEELRMYQTNALEMHRLTSNMVRAPAV